MSLSAIPALRRAAITPCIAVAAAACASRTLARVTITPTRTSATSGTVVTRPMPLTLIVCSGVVAPSTARAGRAARAGPKATASTRPASAPTKSQPRRGRAMEPVRSVIGWLLRTGCRAAGDGSGSLTRSGRVRFHGGARSLAACPRVRTRAGRSSRSRCRASRSPPSGRRPAAGRFAPAPSAPPGNVRGVDLEDARSELRLYRCGPIRPCRATRSRRSIHGPAGLAAPSASRARNDRAAVRPQHAGHVRDSRRLRAGWSRFQRSTYSASRGACCKDVRAINICGDPRIVPQGAPARRPTCWKITPDPTSRTRPLAPPGCPVPPGPGEYRARCPRRAFGRGRHRVVLVVEDDVVVQVLRRDRASARCRRG